MTVSFYLLQNLFKFLSCKDKSVHDKRTFLRVRTALIAELRNEHEQSLPRICSEGIMVSTATGKLFIRLSTPCDCVNQSKNRQMSEKAEQLFVLCVIFKEWNRKKEAIDTLMELIGEDPHFDKQRRDLFQVVYKQALDPIRHRLHFLGSYLDLESRKNCLSYADYLGKKRDRLVEELIETCKEAISLINDMLLPNSGDPQTALFFRKLVGDFYRYMAEYSDESEANSARQSAEEAYHRAMSDAELSLEKYDPVRLGIILNYAVFKYDICSEHEMAKGILEDVISGIKVSSLFVDGLEPESANMVQIMMQNLQSW